MKRLSPAAGSLLFALVCAGCLPSGHGNARKGPGFRDVTARAGIRFQYDNDESPQRRFVETTGGGCAFLDFDNDGWLDIVAVQGGPAPGSLAKGRPPHALYRNLRDGRFRDEAKERGLDLDLGYGQGVSAADFDNDGWCDLLITAYGGAYLLRNEKGRFRDVSKQAGLGADPAGDRRWYTSAAWADFDRDGWLDLFLCRYVAWSTENDHPCADARGELNYCPPGEFRGDTSRLLRNVRGKRFADVSREAGLDQMLGKALGAAWLDNHSGPEPELFVASDMSPNWLLTREPGGGWTDRAPRYGLAVSPYGFPLSGMGVSVGDFDGDLLEDIVVTNFSRQPRSYYAKRQAGGYEWRTGGSGLGDMEQPFLAFGTDVADFDLDGDLDLVIGNGHINPSVDSLGEGVTYRERQQLFLNDGTGVFQDDRGQAGDLDRPRVTRGLAVGDFDNDGRVDCLVSGPREPLSLFRNELKPKGRWIGLILRGAASNRDGVGAKAILEEGGAIQVRTVRSGSSYCSRSDTRLVFGLRGSDELCTIRVDWPTGRRQVYRDLKPGGYRLLVEGR